MRAKITKYAGAKPKAEEKRPSQGAGVEGVPEGWTIAGLGESGLADIIMGQSPSSRTYNKKGIGLPFFQGKAEFGDIHPTLNKWCSDPIRTAKEKDILVSVRAPVGDANIAPFECCIGRGLAAIRPKSSLDPFYLFYYLRLSKKRLESEGGGTTFRAINKSVLENFQILLPPLVEQHRIAKILGTIQKAIEQQDKIIEAVKNLKKSLMQKLFREGIGHNELEESSEIGQMPKDWKIVTIDDLRDSPKGSIVSGPFGSNIGRRFFVKEGVPLIRGNNLTKGEKLFVEEGFVFITEQKAQELRSCTALPDDIIFTAAGTLGQVGMIPKNSRYAKYIISNKQLRARIDKNKAFPLFLFYWFSGPTIQRLINQRKGGTSIPVINLGILRRLPIPLPKLEEQKQIAHILSTADKKIEVEDKGRAALEELFRTLLHKLMTGEIRLKDVEV